MGEKKLLGRNSGGFGKFCCSGEVFWLWYGEKKKVACTEFKGYWGKKKAIIRDHSVVLIMKKTAD